MPATKLIYFRNESGSAPVLEWLDDLSQHNKKAYAKCKARISNLEVLGNELKRPIADYLRAGIYELRAREGNVNYRLLYFFHDNNIAILAHACTKKGEVPEVEISRAFERKTAFIADPAKYTYTEEHSEQ